MTDAAAPVMIRMRAGPVSSAAIRSCAAREPVGGLPALGVRLVICWLSRAWNKPFPFGERPRQSVAGVGLQCRQRRHALPVCELGYRGLFGSGTGAGASSVSGDGGGGSVSRYPFHRFGGASPYALVFCRSRKRPASSRSSSHRRSQVEIPRSPVSFFPSAFFSDAEAEYLLGLPPGYLAADQETLAAQGFPGTARG